MGKIFGRRARRGYSLVEMLMVISVIGIVASIAIPLLFLNAGLVSLSRSVVNVLEEQSTRLLAVRLESASH